ncbi:MAG TPA: hypothetical protein LFW21_00075 [Rickettsia endosymbiont of Pyrocoelia pectoralis]|nr:hypothetical protein [Rickettsia endosymbiont of Pyrocoelia pectoralis]
MLLKYHVSLATYSSHIFVTALELDKATNYTPPPPPKPVVNPYDPYHNKTTATTYTPPQPPPVPERQQPVKTKTKILGDDSHSNCDIL